MTAAASDYDLLGLAPGATQEQIRRAFRKRAFTLHPDRNPSPEAAEAFLAVRAAYERLSEPGGSADFEIERVAADLIAAAEEAQRRRAGATQTASTAWQRVRVPLAAGLRDRLRRGYRAGAWAAEAHAVGLDDLRWDVRLGWAEVAAVEAAEGRVALTLTPDAARRARAEAPTAFVAGTYVLPTPEAERLATIVRRRAGCE